jgi:hypothetical protein
MEKLNMKAKTLISLLLELVVIAAVIGVVPVSATDLQAQASSIRTTSNGNLQTYQSPTPKITTAVAFDATLPLRDLAARAAPPPTEGSLPPERGPVVVDQGFSGDGARQSDGGASAALDIPEPLLTFEGLSNTDNPFLVVPPDPVGDVGPNHYVEMVNLVFSVYDKQGNQLLAPTPLGVLWDGFAIDDCTDLSGDPIVLYDQFADRWILTQFTTRGLDAGGAFYNCVAVSQTGDPTGAYFRYAFTSGLFFPDYPKYGVWRNSYLLTSRDFGQAGEYGISVYALERSRMINGNPNARSIQFFLDSAVVPINLIGDGLLPADVDGTRLPAAGAAAPIIGTQDDGGPYGAPFDALNVYELSVDWRNVANASLALVAQLPVAGFDSIFPCHPSRNCIPQPDTAIKLDILSYRQRPTWRLAYRRIGNYETMVTNQSVEALRGIAGVRWYEIRRSGGQFSLHQQGTYAPDDGVHRWMGSLAMDKNGNIGLGYSVSSSSVYPGIRYTGRLSGDAPGQMTLGEGVIIDGSGSQLNQFRRWGDYTSMNIDPVDDCTFWYINEYVETTGPAFWQTRIGSFKLGDC